MSADGDLTLPIRMLHFMQEFTVSSATQNDHLSVENTIKVWIDTELERAATATAQSLTDTLQTYA
jgi:hypothetical protein